MCLSLFSGLHHIKINKLLNYHFKQFSTSTLLMGVGQSDGWVCWYLVMLGLLTGVLVLLCRSRNIIGQIIFHNMLNRQEGGETTLVSIVCDTFPVCFELFL